MKFRHGLLSLFVLCLVAAPAVAQNDLYDNGPTNGTAFAWTINNNFVESDTFTLSEASTINGLNFAAWLIPGDILQSADVSITSNEFGGTSYFNQTVSFTQSGCSLNGSDYFVCNESGTFAGVSLNAGTYWLNLQNAVVSNGDPVYWTRTRARRQPQTMRSVRFLPSHLPCSAASAAQPAAAVQFLSPAASFC